MLNNLNNARNSLIQFTSKHMKYNAWKLNILWRYQKALCVFVRDLTCNYSLIIYLIKISVDIGGFGDTYPIIVYISNSNSTSEILQASAHKH